MNMQEVHNKIKAHLLAQGCASVLPSDTCAYRGAGGRMCAVGCLITDEAYAKRNVSPEQMAIEELDWPNRLEGQAAYNSEVREALGDSGVFVQNNFEEGLLQKWQGAHDACRVWQGEKWARYIEERAVEIARQFGINP